MKLAVGQSAAKPHLAGRRVISALLLSLRDLHLFGLGQQLVGLLLAFSSTTWADVMVFAAPEGGEISLFFATFFARKMTDGQKRGAAT
jgi:hypothetical protein